MTLKASSARRSMGPKHNRPRQRTGGEWVNREKGIAMVVVLIRLENDGVPSFLQTQAGNIAPGEHHAKNGEQRQSAVLYLQMRIPRDGTSPG